MADVKYPDYTPVDEPIRTGPKPAEPGSGIKVEKEPTKAPNPPRAGTVQDMTKKTPPKKEGYSKGGSVSSASKRADGIAQRGKTRGKMVMCGGGRV